MRRWGLTLVLAAALAVSAGLHSTTSNASTATRSGYRWTVKTLQDRPKLLPARKTTIHFLITRPDAPATRLLFERHIYTVTAAAVVIVRPEADSYLHVADPARRNSHDSGGAVAEL